VSGVRTGERLHVACVDLDDDGAGLGGEAPRVHVAGLLPGEEATAVVEHVSSQRAEAWARLERIERTSPARRAPACAAFGRCGGCVLQHLAYEEQLVWKTARMRRALEGVAGLPAIEVAACVPSPRPLGYRNRSKLVAARAGGRMVLGAYKPRTHEVVDLAGCRVAEPPLDDVAASLRDLFDAAAVTAYDERTLGGDLRYVVLRVNHAGEVLAVWVTARPLPGGDELARRFRAARPEVTGVVENLNRSRGNAIYGPDDRLLDGAGVLAERVGGVELRLSARAFFQANRDVAALAYAALARALAVRADERAVDAYAGAGGIALTLAPAAGEVIGIEAHAGAVADATAAATLNGAANARFVAADAATGLGALDRADVVVLNPPRRGCEAAVLGEVARLAPRAIGYLSCAPDTLARDLALLAAHGYRLRTVTPFDMLPHTPHVEALAILDRVQT